MGNTQHINNGNHGHNFHLAYDQVVLERIPSLALGVAIVFALFAPIDMTLLPVYARNRIVIHDLAVALALFVTWYLSTKKLVLPRTVNPLVSLLSLLVMSNVLHSFYLLSDKVYAIDFIIILISSSMVILSFRWSTFVVTVGVGAWTLLSWNVLLPDEFVRYLLSISAAGAVSMFIQGARLLSHRRHENMKIQSEQQQQELQHTLASTKLESLDRERAEAENARLEAQLIQAQKMEAVGRLAGGVAHDINNMLTVIKGSSEVMLIDTPTGSDKWNDLKTILAACKRGQELTQNLLGFARQGKYRRERIQINSLITDVLNFLKRTMPKKIRLGTDLSPDLREIEGDPGQMNQVFVNLVLNAADAIEDTGSIRIRTQQEHIDAPKEEREVTVEPGDYVKIIVTDDGAGMDDETAQKAFEPFFTKKRPGEGTGLGLSMVYGTVKHHGGYVFIRSRVGEGTEIAIYLPACKTDSPPSGDDFSKKVHLTSGVGTVLLVDDEPLVRRSGERILRTLGYDVIHAENGKVAVEQYQKHGSKISLVILDLLMPVMDGEEAFRALKEMNPDIKVLFASGYSKDEIPNDLLRNGAASFVEKPFSLDEISRILGDIIQG